MTTTRTARTRAVIYARVSTAKQGDAGVSLDAQEAKARAYCDLYDIDVVEVVTDVASAKTLDRPGLRRVLAALDAGAADAVVVVKLDRLTRSVKHAGELVETRFASGKAALVSVGEQIDTRTAAGRLVLNVLMSVAQWEREAIGERTAAAMQHKAARGEYTGGRVPYGFRLADDGTLTADEAEAAVLAAARRLRAAGMGPRKIAAELTELGYAARNGKPFTPTQAARLVAA